ncbi:hypothetical protein KR100_13135 [Synechococcus sp. KORDI-100]|nr:hypothetical protein KR100_13135 [Synechococcus sp. KORDI-100]
MQAASVASPVDSPVRSAPADQPSVLQNVTLLAIAALVGVTPLVWVILYPPGS